MLLINFHKIYNFAKNFQNKNRIMKKKGSKSDYIQSRNENLKREFIKRMGKNGWSVSRVIESLTMIPADRFYISEERAYGILKKMEKDETSGTAGEDNVRNRRRLTMIMEIKRRVENLLKEEPGKSMQDAVFEVVNSRAPGFYLSQGTIRTLLYGVLRQYRKEASRLRATKQRG